MLKMTMGPGISVSPSAGLTTTEGGGSAAFDVVLDTAPTADVTIFLTSSDTSEGTVSPGSLTFTPVNWNLPQTVTITGVDDSTLDGEVAYSIITAAAPSTDPGYNGLNAVDVGIANLDNDAPPLDAFDDFDSGNFTGGTGWADGGWTVSGDATLNTRGEFSSPYHVRLRRSTGDLIRTVDTTGLSSVMLSFQSKLYSFENSDVADVRVSFDGSNWTTIKHFVNGEDNNQYSFYEYEVPVAGNTMYLRFDAGMSSSGDYWYIDDVHIVAVGPVNTAPIALNDAGFSLDEDGTLTVNATSGVLINDSDAESDPLTASIITGAANGDVTLNADGSFTYVPDADYNGNDSFAYRASDGTSDSTWRRSRSL